MKTNFSASLTTVCIIIFSIIYFSSAAKAQDKKPKNFVGISGIAELNRLAVGCGLEYERWLYTNNQFALGAKVNHIFTSKTLNYIFSPDDLFQKNSQTHLMATTYFFTGKEKKPKGFFLSFGLGLNFIKWSQERLDAGGNYHTASISEISPGFDISLGGQFVNKNRRAVRITGGYQAFAADKYNQFVSGNGISLLYAKISIGF